MPITEQLLKDVAAAMAGRWTAELIYEHVGRLTEHREDSTPSAELSAFCHPPGHDRIEWTGVFPKDSSGAVYVPSKQVRISVATTRQPEAIARDLERRLLTWYRPALAQALERVQESNRREDEAAATVNVLSRIFKLESRQGRFWFDHGTVEVDVSGIKIHLTFQLAAAAEVGAALLPLLRHDPRVR